jgi:ribosomal protein L12E/L44/L45/RPP1/RPP2
MKTLAAALLIALSGKEVTEDGIKKIFTAAGAKGDDEEIKKVVNSLKGKKVDNIIADGLKKLSGMSVGESKGEEKGKKEDKKEKKKEEKKKEEKKEEEEEEDMGFGGLF